MIFLSRGWFSKTHIITTCKIIKYGFIMFIIDWFQSAEYDTIDKPKYQKMVDYILTLVYFLLFCTNFWSLSN